VHEFTTLIALVGIVIVAASLLSGAVERVGLPLPAAVLALGALLGPFGMGVADVPLRSTTLAVLATLGLTLVLFSDAVTLELSEVRRHRALALRLLGPGTLLPAAVIGLVAWWLLDVPPAAAAILGAALASTDPVLLRTLVRTRTLPDAVRTGLRLESGMNDVVLLPIVLIAIAALRGDNAVADGGTRLALGLFVLGPTLGALVGWVGIVALERVRTRLGVRRDYESLYALALAFAAYAAAESVGGSGFVAAFAAGFVVSTLDVELCDCFLEYGEATAEMLLLLTFVALGTSAIWAGFIVLDWRTLLVAVVALGARTVTLYPMLGGLGLSRGECRTIALFGPRGLSSLLLVLLAVFAKVEGAERLFATASLAVLLSVAIHGVGIAIYLGRQRSAPPTGAGAGAWAGAGAGAGTVPAVPERISVAEMQELRARGEPVVVVDARSERNYRGDSVQALGAVRLHPAESVRDARAMALDQHATLVVYCA